MSARRRFASPRKLDYISARRHEAAAAMKDCDAFDRHRHPMFRP
jgi:hypothetical protein